MNQFLGKAMKPTVERVCIVGSGNWGSAIAKIVGNNVIKRPERFDPKVNMWVYEEMIGDRKLTEIINTEHINVKYLPGIKLPENVYAEPDLVNAAKDATLLVFVIPHQFVKGVCEKLIGRLHPNARAISLIKGLDGTREGLHLISDLIKSTLSIDVSVMMGANIASEVAQEQFCEATIGCKSMENGAVFKSILATDYFLINCIKDVQGVELCGALKNVVAVAAGIVDGLGFGENTKAAIIRIGLIEMKKFASLFSSLSNPDAPKPVINESENWETYFESCGVADLITTCFGGRNRRISELFVKEKKSFRELEELYLNGQKLQGPDTAQEIHKILSEKNLTSKFPLFTLVYQIAYKGLSPSEMFGVLARHSSDEAHHGVHKL